MHQASGLTAVCEFSNSDGGLFAKLSEDTSDFVDEAGGGSVDLSHGELTVICLGEHVGHAFLVLVCELSIGFAR